MCFYRDYLLYRKKLPLKLTFPSPSYHFLSFPQLMFLNVSTNRQCNSQEPRSAATPLDLDDDSVSVQSQETDKQPETPSSSLSKSSSGSKESTPQPVDEKQEEEKKDPPEPEKKVSFDRLERDIYPNF